MTSNSSKMVMERAYIPISVLVPDLPPKDAPSCVLSNIIHSAQHAGLHLGVSIQYCNYRLVGSLNSESECL